MILSNLLAFGPLLSVLMNGTFLLAPMDAGLVTPAYAQEQAQEDTSVKEPVGAMGWIEPKSRVLRVGSPSMIDGARVERLDVQEGDIVKKGQMIGVFSTYDKNKATYNSAKSNLLLAEANLEKVLAGTKKNDILSQKRVVESLKASEESAALEFARVERLYFEKMASKSQYDSAKAEKDSIEAQRKSAEETLASLKIVRPEDVSIAKAQIEVAKSEVAVAKAGMDLSTIFAPIDGEILTIYARNAEAVGDMGVLDIASLDVMDVVAEVDENDILKISKGNKAEITIPGFTQQFKGVVRDIGGQIRKNTMMNFDSRQIVDTRIIEVRIELDPKDNGIARRLVNKKVRVKIFK